MLKTLATALLLAPIFAPSATQEKAPDTPRPVEGTRITLTLPKRFTPLARFAGFGDALTGEAIVVTELEAPLEVLITSLEAQTQVKSEEIKPRGTEDLAQGSHAGTMFRFEQMNADRHVHKWIWAFGSEKECVLIAGESEFALGEEAFVEMRSCVASAKWVLTRAANSLDTLPYEFAKPEGIQLALATAGKAAFTPDGQYSGVLGEKPILECAIGTQALTVSIREFAENALKSDKRLKSVRVSTIDRMDHDGLDGYEVYGSGQSVNGDLMFTYDLVLAEGASYIRISTLVGLGDKSEWENKLEKVIYSFRRKRTVLKATDESFTVTVPATWELLPPFEDQISIQAGQHVAGLYLTALSEDRSLFEGDLTLTEYHAATVSDLERDAGGDLKPRSLEIHGMPALMTEYDALAEGFERHFLHVVLESKTHFYVLTLHCPTAFHKWSKADLESVLMSFAEAKSE